MTFERFTPDIEINKTNDHQWHTLGTEEVLSKLNTMADQGLTSEEAERRLETFGLNQLTEKAATSFWQMIWEQFNNFVVMLLIVSSVISAILGDWIEAAAIMAIVILNAALGVIQEKAGRASFGGSEETGRS